MTQASSLSLTNVYTMKTNTTQHVLYVLLVVMVAMLPLTYWGWNPASMLAMVALALISAVLFLFVQATRAYYMRYILAVPLNVAVGGAAEPFSVAAVLAYAEREGNAFPASRLLGLSVNRQALIAELAKVTVGRPFTEDEALEIIVELNILGYGELRPYLQDILREQGCDADIADRITNRLLVAYEVLKLRGGKRPENTAPFRALLLNPNLGAADFDVTAN